MDDQYGGLPADFRQLMGTRGRGEQLSSTEPIFSVHRNLTSASPATTNNNCINYQSQSGLLVPGLVPGGLDLVEFGSSAANGVALYGVIDQTLERESSSSGFYNNNNNNNNNNIIISSGEPNNSRWPRQETLTLLEIRSRLNSKFKDTNQKGPLWDEVSRIMMEEHGYQRSGKKCKEKFENLYKYYKKTKEGKAGRQDGKHYRFFRQLESIYGDQTDNNQSETHQYLHRNNSLLHDQNLNRAIFHHEISQQDRLDHDHDHHHHHHHQDPNYYKLGESLSFSINNSTELETASSSENNEEDDLSALIAFKMNNQNQSINMDQKMKGIININEGRHLVTSTCSMKPSRKSWKTKVEEFVDSQMKKIMATQESWMEKMLKSVIDKEEERVAKEEEWRRQEAARFDQEVNEFWAKEKAWIEARDAALMGALNKFTGKGIELPCLPQRMVGKNDHHVDYHRWNEQETSSLIELTTSLETTTSFRGNHHQCGLWDWEEISSKMACLGYERSALECKHKWESISVYVRMTSDCKKKRKEDYFKSSATCNYFDNHQQVLQADHDFDHKGHHDHDHDHHHHHHGQSTLKQDDHHHQQERLLGLQLMGEGFSPSTSNLGTQMHPNNCFHLMFGDGENLWEKYGNVKPINKDKINHQLYNK